MTDPKEGSIVIIGSGLIGRSWAMVFASGGFKVRLYDIVKEQVTAALEDIRKQMEELRKSGMLRGSLSSEEQIALISGFSDLKLALEGAIFVQIIQHHAILYPGKNDNIPMSVRNTIWQEIVSKVNTIGVAMRTMVELKKKWNDLKAKVKFKLGYIARQARQTGGGPSTTVSLSLLEEKVATVFAPEQIEGVGEVDVCLQASRPEPTMETTVNMASLEELGNDAVVFSPRRELEDEPLQIHTETTEPQIAHTIPTIPPDVGISVPLSTFLNSYAEQQVAFMTNVNARLEGIENCFGRVGDAIVAGNETMGQALQTLASILSQRPSQPPPKPPTMSPSNSSTNSTNQSRQTVMSANGHLEEANDTQLSNIALDLDTVVPYLVQQPVPSPILHYFSPEQLPIDLSIEKNAPQTPGPSDVSLQQSSPPKDPSASEFLLNIKQELAREPESQVVRKVGSRVYPGKVRRGRRGRN